VVFVQLSGQRVYEMQWQGVSNTYDAPKDLSFFSSHLFVGNPITAWEYCQAPDTIAYFLRTDGSLAPLHYNPAYGIMAWWQLELHEGAVITSIAAQTGLTGDTLFLAVTRGVYNYIEMLSNPDWTDMRLSCYLDCATQKYNAIPYTTVAVNASFNGQTLSVVADGKYVGTAVPAAGILTLPGGITANYATVGIPMATPTVKTMPLSPEGTYGPGLTDLRNIDHVGLVLYNTLDIQTGTDGSVLQSCTEVEALKIANPTLFNGEPEPIPINTTNVREPILVIQSANPLPCEVTAMVPVVSL
jgi:hypothetical protein